MSSAKRPEEESTPVEPSQGQRILQDALVEQRLIINSLLDSRISTVSDEIAREARDRLVAQSKLVLWILGLALFAASLGGAWKLSDIIESEIEQETSDQLQPFETMRAKTTEALAQSQVALAESQIALAKIEKRKLAISQTVDGLQSDLAQIESNLDQISKTMAEIQNADLYELGSRISALNSLNLEQDTLLSLRHAFDNDLRSLRIDLLQARSQLEAISNRTIKTRVSHVFTMGDQDLDSMEGANLCALGGIYLPDGVTAVAIMQKSDPRNPASRANTGKWSMTSTKGVADLDGHFVTCLWVELDENDTQ